MNSAKSKLSTLVVFGIVVFVLAFDSLISLYFALFQNAHSPFAPEDSVFLNDTVIDAFRFQMAGYRLVIFIIAATALFSRRASDIFLVSIGVLVLSLYQALSAINARTFEFQFFVSIFMLVLAAYCLWSTKKTKVQNV